MWPTNLSVGLDRRFPDVFQSESFTVIDQRDRLNVPPQLRQRRTRFRKGEERRRGGEETFQGRRGDKKREKSRREERRKRERKGE